MRWKVEGANANTGEDACIVVYALSEKEAIREANISGILSSNVTPFPEERMWRRVERSPTPKIDKQVVAVLLVFAFLVVSVVLLIWQGNSPEERERRRAEEDHEKANVMRREGLEGSDRELARSADAIKEFNRQEKAREAQKRRVLGGD